MVYIVLYKMICNIPYDLLVRYKFLSNFYWSPVHFEGLVYPSVEHAFQAAKTETQRESFTDERLSFGEAKKRGRQVALREVGSSFWMLLIVGASLEALQVELMVKGGGRGVFL